MAISTAYIEAWDIEATGTWLSKQVTPAGTDVVVAVGCALFEIDCARKTTTLLEKRRWVMDIAPPCTKDWHLVWKVNGYDQRCWDEFWSKHTDILDFMMNDVPAADRFTSEVKMARSIADCVGAHETAYRSKGMRRVFDTLGFDVAHISDLLLAYGFTPLYLWRLPDGRPSNASYLTDVRDRALGIHPVLGATPEQRRARDEHDKLALPDGIVHSHDPADDAVSIGYKWAHYALMTMP